MQTDNLYRHYLARPFITDAIFFLCYSIDARNREFTVAERWSDNSVFSNRAYFMLDKQPALLGVENTREEDAGIYRCRVDFQIGQTRNSKVNLTVIGKIYLTIRHQVDKR